MWARAYNKQDLNCEFYDFSEIYSGKDSRGVPWRDRPSFVGSNIIDSGRLTEMTDADLVEGTLREMEEFFTDVRQAKVLHSAVNRVPMAIHRPVVGTEKLRPDQASPVAGLYFGGCWTNTEFPGSMESAARSGFLAADKLSERNGVDTHGGAAQPYTQLPLLGKLVGKLNALPSPIMQLLKTTLSWLTPPFFAVMQRFSREPTRSKL